MVLKHGLTSQNALQILQEVIEEEAVLYARKQKSFLQILKITLARDGHFVLVSWVSFLTLFVDILLIVCYVGTTKGDIPR